MSSTVKLALVFALGYWLGLVAGKKSLDVQMSAIQGDPLLGMVNA